MSLSFFSESAEGLQKQLTALYSDASIWHIIVSIPKTFIFFNERYPKDIEKAEQYQYLGVVYSTKSVNNVLKETFSHLASQAGRVIFSLRKQSRPVVGKLSPTIAFKVFDCQILSILEYGSDTWYTHDTGDDVNDLEKKNQSHPVKNSYNMLLELDGIGFTNWCSRIRSVLERTGLDQTWESQNVRDTNKFMLSFNESIAEIFTQQWRKDIESSSKLRT